LAMAHSLGLKVVAEGVESADQLRFLRDHGCDEMQGYYFSVAMPEDRATEFLHNALHTQRSAKVTALDPSRRAAK
ncbi:MAG: EAL domain-containing protein, partial [Burkholderiales bacterium]